jgi:hypothetical protein
MNGIVESYRTRLGHSYKFRMGSGGSFLKKRRPVEEKRNSDDDVYIPIKYLANHLRVYQHCLRGEVLVLIDEKIDELSSRFIEDAHNWFQVSLSSKEKDYLSSVKVMTTVVETSSDLVTSGHLARTASSALYARSLKFDKTKFTASDSSNRMRSGKQLPTLSLSPVMKESGKRDGSTAALPAGSLGRVADTHMSTKQVPSSIVSETQDLTSFVASTEQQQQQPQQQLPQNGTSYAPPRSSSEAQVLMEQSHSLPAEQQSLTSNYTVTVSKAAESDHRPSNEDDVEIAVSPAFSEGVEATSSLPEELLIAGIPLSPAETHLLDHAHSHSVIMDNAHVDEDTGNFVCSICGTGGYVTAASPAFEDHVSRCIINKQLSRLFADVDNVLQPVSGSGSIF